MPPGTWRCQPKGYRAPALVIVCNYPANLFTSAGAAWWSWGSNCQNGGKNGKRDRGVSDGSGWGWRFIIGAREGRGRTEQLIAFIKCSTVSEATFSFSFLSRAHSLFDFSREERDNKVRVYGIVFAVLAVILRNLRLLLTSLFKRFSSRRKESWNVSVWDSEVKAAAPIIRCFNGLMCVRWLVRWQSIIAFAQTSHTKGWRLGNVGSPRRQVEASPQWSSLHQTHHQTTLQALRALTNSPLLDFS